MARFREYLDSKGKTVEKAVVDDVADKVDVPKPKAKEDPHNDNKSKKKADQVKEAEEPKTSRWQEYLNAKGKLVDPKVAPVADYSGPDPSTPEGSGGLKPSAGQPVPKSEKAAPYRAANSNESKGGAEKGFGDMGGKELVYEPNTETDGQNNYVPGGKSIPSWGGKTEAFLNTTKDMSLSEFTQHMLQECACETENLPKVTAMKRGGFHPNPVEAVKYVAALASKNDRVMESLVFEIKHQKALNQLLKQLLEHPETYDELTVLFEDIMLGESRCNAFARAMHFQHIRTLEERVGPPMVGVNGEKDEDEDDDEEEGEDVPTPEDDEMDGEDMDDDEMDDEEGDMDDMGGMEGDVPPNKSASNKVIDAMKNYMHMKKYMSRK